MLWVTLFLSFSSLAWYYAWNTILNSWYKDTYTLEDINKKLLSQQKKVAQKIEEELKNTSHTSESQRINGSVKYWLEANSSFGWWNADFSINNLDIQYKDKNLDVSLNDLEAKWGMEFIWQKEEASFWIKDLHFLSNASWSYVKAEDITYTLSDLLKESFPEEFILTLNKLWKSWKYVNLGGNFMYNAMQEQISSQNDTTKETQDFIIDFLENEAILTAYKQEGTKYHLAPSEALCKLKKGEKSEDTDKQAKEVMNELSMSFWNNPYGSSPYDSIPSYDEFTNQYITCNEQEYQDFIQAFMQSDIHTLTDFYIELSPQKLHFVSNIEFTSPDDSEEDKKIKINTGFEGVFTLTHIESSSFYTNIFHDKVSWSGILLENNNGNISWYIDIDLPEYKFDSNASFSGTVDYSTMSWDYSYEFPEDMSDSDPEMLQWVKLTGNINTIAEKWGGSTKILNTFSSTDEYGVSGELSIDSEYSIEWSAYSGLVDINGSMQIWNNASPMSWDAKLIWSNEYSPSSAKWDYDFSLNIPNIASGKYFVNYDFKLDKAIEADFKSPEDVISEKSLNTLIKINKGKVEKEREKAQAEKMKRLAQWNTSLLNPYALDALNSKVQSDLRTLVSIIETELSRGTVVYSDIIDISETRETEAWKITEWTIIFKSLGQNSEDFKAVDWSEYKIYLFEPTNEEDYPMYQVAGFIYTPNWKEVNTKGNYLQIDSSFPPSMVYDEKNKKYYERGDIIPYE